MSNIKEAFQKGMEIEKLKAETDAKRAVLDAKRISMQLEQVEKNERDLEKTQSANYGALSASQIAAIRNQNREYMEAAQKAMVFIHPLFDQVVPFFRKNLILIGARTGAGKSTAVANIARTNITRKNPETGNTYRTLVITNEERAEDVYNRVTFLIKGWHYTNHRNFTEEQRKTTDSMIPVLASGGRLTVIDDNHNDSHGVTTTLEGIDAIFKSLVENKEYYDTVIIDYYQNIKTSSKNLHLSENDVQSKLSILLDRYKNIYPAPIVVMAQVNPPDKDGKEPFQHRIKGRKVIMDPTTFAVEMISDTANLLTKWAVHKSRFTDSIGKEITTGYDKGKFVLYDSAFIEKVQKMAYEKQVRQINAQLDKASGIPDTVKEKD